MEIHTAAMTLGGTISSVPQLGSACSSVLTGDEPGSGIKLMRLVSKQLRSAMLGVVQRYTFQLAGSGVELIKEMSLLQSTKLSFLRIVITNNTGGACPWGLHGWKAHTLQLRCFITGMGPAIGSITRLEVESHPSFGTGSMESVTALLCLLTPACPALQQLKVAGDIGREFLATIGASCAELFSLEVLNGVKSEHLDQLRVLLPNLTHCKVLASVKPGLHTFPMASPSCLSLLSCSSLTNLDVGAAFLTSEMWSALPKGLKVVRCQLKNTALTVVVVMLGNLRLFHCVCNPDGDYVELGNLVWVLRMAPKLQSVLVEGVGKSTLRSNFISEVYVPCIALSVPHLIYLYGRICAGLAIQSTQRAGGIFQGINISLWLEDSHTAQHHLKMDEYLATLPCFSAPGAFAGLVLWTGLHSKLSTIVPGIRAVFPQLTSLVLELPGSICVKDLKHLGCFTALERLSLQEAQVSATSLAILCSRITPLKLLRLVECRGCSIAEGKSLQGALHQCGSSTEVLVVDPHDLKVDPDEDDP